MNIEEALQLVKTIQELWDRQSKWSKEISDEGIGWTIKNTIDKNKAKELVKSLDTCKCCPIHQKDRPSSLENYLGYNCNYCKIMTQGDAECPGLDKCQELCDQIYNQNKSKECECSCRCISRHICRVYCD